MNKKPICIQCQTSMKCIEIGANLFEMFQDPPRPYKLWSVDVYRCNGCGCKTIGGWSNRAFEHYEEDFEHRVTWAEDPDNPNTLIRVYEKPQPFYRPMSAPEKVMLAALMDISNGPGDDHIDIAQQTIKAVNELFQKLNVKEVMSNEAGNAEEAKKPI